MGYSRPVTGLLSESTAAIGLRMQGSMLKQEANKPVALDTISVVCFGTFLGLVSILVVCYRFTLRRIGTKPCSVLLLTPLNS